MLEKRALLQRAGRHGLQMYRLPMDGVLWKETLVASNSQASSVRDFPGKLKCVVHVCMCTYVHVYAMVRMEIRGQL